MTMQHKILSILISLLALMQPAWASEVVEYRFAGMLPPTQLWDFDEPTSIATAPDGSVWIADPQAKRIQHVHADGSLIAQFNIDVFPNDIALAPDGSVWLANVDSITHYSAVGKLLKAFGSQQGNGVGQFDYPNIAIARDGSIWVADQGKNYVQHFTDQGDVIVQLKNPACPDCTGGVAGAVGIVPDDSLWVATRNNQIHHYADNGRLIATVVHGDKATSDGSLVNLEDIAVSSDGSVWVVDRLWTESKANLRLHHLHTDGSRIAQFDTDDYTSNASLAAAKDGSVWLTYGDRIKHFKADGSVIAHFGAGSGIGQFNRPSKLAFAPDNSVWVYNENDSRLQHFDASGGFIAESVVVYQDSIYASFSYALASDGSKWQLVDNGRNIQHISADGRIIAKFNQQVIDMLTKSPSSGWNLLTSISVATDDSLWVVSKNFRNWDIMGSVADPSNDYFWHLNTDGSVIAKIKGSGGVASQAGGSVWIANAESNRIQHFAADGSLVTQFGSLGAGRGQFKQPQSIAVAKDGSIWVADSGNNRIQKFVPKTLPNSPAEYDDKNGLLYLDDVAVDGTHYQATLQFQNDQYRLLTVLPALNVYSPAASFDITTNLLSIPLVRAFGQDYQAQFKYLEDSMFQLLSVTSK